MSSCQNILQHLLSGKVYEVLETRKRKRKKMINRNREEEYNNTSLIMDDEALHSFPVSLINEQ